MTNVEVLPYMTHDQLLKSLEDALGSPLEIINIKTSTPNLKGQHFISAVDTLDVTVKKDNEVSVEKLFVKLATPDESRKEVMSNMTPTYKEVIFFNEVLPDLKKFCTKEILDKNPVLVNFPHCYFAEHSPYDPIVLENLTAKGFAVNPSNIDQGMDYARLVFIGLAELHAVSSLYLRKTKNQIVSKHDCLNFSYYIPSMIEQFGTVYTNAFKTGISVLNTPQHKEKYDNMSLIGDTMFDIFPALDIPCDPFNCICIGDCWNNNLMFKLNEQGKPIDVKFLDFQICRYSSIAFDFNYYFTTTTNADNWKNDVPVYMKIYYDSFQKTCSRFGEKPPFPFTDFEQHVRDRMIVSAPIMFSIMGIRHLPSDHFTDPSEAEDGKSDMMDEFCRGIEKMVTDEKYKHIMLRRVLALYEETEKSLKNQLSK